jgi:AcrR family transcriptional regulator
MIHLLTYIGRQTSRSDGEARRVIILEATLRLIVKEGIRGVRHRAVAKEANVPLASTTYYFKDIKVLINDSLTYFAEKTLWMNKVLESRSFELIHDRSELGSHRDDEQLQTHLSQFICEHIREQVKRSDDRILEMAFHEEALRSPQLADAISTLDDSFLATIKFFFDKLGSDTSLADAYQLLGLIKLLEYQYVVRGNIIEDKIQFENIVNSSVRKIIGIREST